MLRLNIVITEGFDDINSQFVDGMTVTVELEHSLVSLSKWESKYEKPFLGEETHSTEQTLDYIEMMILGEIPEENALSHLSAANIKEIQAYIDAKMTATWFNEQNIPKGSREIVTAEIIYYWMITLGIPFECQNWHLNRLLTLVKVCNIKNQPKKNMNKAQSAQMQTELNRQRREATGSSG
jgi:hypothetical protein